MNEQLVSVTIDGVEIKARGENRSIYWTSDWSRIYELKDRGYVTERVYGHGLWRDSEFRLA